MQVANAESLYTTLPMPSCLSLQALEQAILNKGNSLAGNRKTFGAPGIETGEVPFARQIKSVLVYIAGDEDSVGKGAK